MIVAHNGVEVDQFAGCWIGPLPDTPASTIRHPNNGDAAEQSPSAAMR